MNAYDTLNILLKKNLGYLRTADAEEAGVSRTVLGSFVQENNLERVARGLYLEQDVWRDSLFEAQFRYPRLVFSHETALYLLDLTDRVPTHITVTLETSSGATRLREEGIKTYRIKQELFAVGLSEVETLFGHHVRCYNAERTICDIVRSRRNVEIQDMQTAIRDYLKSKQKNIPLLLRYAKQFSVEKIIRQYTEVLL